jgi:hypothetical protein
MLKKIRNNADTTTRIKVETFRIINNIDKVNSNKIFPKNEKTTRGHKHAIYKKHCRTNIRKYSFSQRVVETWNSLPAKVIESNTVNGLKNQLNSHWKDLQNQIQARYIQTGSDNWICPIKKGRRG